MTHTMSTRLSPETEEMQVKPGAAVLPFSDLKCELRARS